LKQPNRRIELDIGGYHPEFIGFHSLAHIRETNWKGRKLLDLLAVDATGYLPPAVGRQSVRVAIPLAGARNTGDLPTTIGR